MQGKKFLFFDTVVLSNFAFVENGISFLKKRYSHRGKVTFQVLQELAKATYSGFNELERIEKNLFLKDGFEKTSLTEKEQEVYMHLLRNLGDGEASCIASALQRKAVVVTDDRAARNFCKERLVAVTGTVGILKAACLDGIIEIDEADCMLEQMISYGFYSPVRRISDTF